MARRKAVLAMAVVPALLALPLVASARHLQADESPPPANTDTVFEAHPFVVDVDIDPWARAVTTRRLVLGTKKKARPVLLDPWTDVRVRAVPPTDAADPWNAPPKADPWKAPQTDSVDPWNGSAPATTPPRDEADPWEGVNVPARPRSLATWSVSDPAHAKADAALQAAIQAAVEAGDMELAEKLIKLAMRRNVAPPSK
jgi:hypothetical protein